MKNEHAKAKEQIWMASERRETAIILKILKTSDEVDADIAELNLSDIEIKFSRSRIYDLATKCNSLATLINIGIDPLRAIEIGLDVIRGYLVAEISYNKYTRLDVPGINAGDI